MIRLCNRILSTKYLRRKNSLKWGSFFPLLVVVLLLTNAEVVYAGFGITPPYLLNHRLTRGSVYEQRITLVRSDPTDDLNTEITVSIPEIAGWISIDRGTKFVMPKGATQVPINVTVRVPSNAEFKEYKGAIRVRTSPTEMQPGQTGVSIALGAQIDVDLKVVDKIYDFSVRKIRLTDLEEGRTKFGLFFPGKIRFFMTVENTGNTEFGPTKVRFEIYDSNGETLLETTENLNKIEKIAPFATREILAELPTRLPSGLYSVKYTIFKNDEIAQQGTLDLSISAIGAVAGYTGYGFQGLSLGDKLKVIAMIGVPLILLLIFVTLLLQRRNRKVKKGPYASRIG
jgi:hypothetical protein